MWGRGVLDEADPHVMANHCQLSSCSLGAFFREFCVPESAVCVVCARPLLFHVCVECMHHVPRPGSNRIQICRHHPIASSKLLLSGTYIVLVLQIKQLATACMSPRRRGRHVRWSPRSHGSPCHCCVRQHCTCIYTSAPKRQNYVGCIQIL
jgi:hypothetical protein